MSSEPLYTENAASQVWPSAYVISSAWAMARKPDEIKNSRRAATAPARNAVEIPLLRRCGATHRSAQRRRRRCDMPCAKSGAICMHSEDFFQFFCQLLTGKCQLLNKLLPRPAPLPFDLFLAHLARLPGCFSCFGTDSPTDFFPGAETIYLLVPRKHNGGR